MTGTDLRAKMAERGWTVRGLAAELGVMPGTVQRWRSDETPVPPYLHLALSKLEERVSE